MVKGKRVKLRKWIDSDLCAVRVEVEAVIPDADPSEPCLEPETLRHLDHLRQLVAAGKISELEKYGDVYVRQSA